ncbi:DNA-cytosine methyltransferase [hydrothermal vent metagenome]|uniref:DNA (cytosine-5-)-methyltransferase n=1 Tax=hydrothermal vent metagenome TaxID=652676 RepID=A0A3B0W278_9ZZZZ
MKLHIKYQEAINLLQSYVMANGSGLASNPELIAIITHWLQNPGTVPPYSTENFSAAWLQYLKVYELTQKTSIEARQKRQIKPEKYSLQIQYSENGSTIPFPPLKRPKFDFIDLFAGIGGFRIALQSIGGQCVLSSEWDTGAKETYFRNFGEFPYGDVRQFTRPEISDETIADTIPDHDILAAGFPCQPFSLAGVSARNSLSQLHGFACETQGTLFFDIVRIAHVKRPKVLFLENVKNLINHDGGRTFEIIKHTIEDELGYSFKHKIIDASTLVPQHRERCYMICFRDPNVEFEFHDSWFSGEPRALREILEEEPDPQYTISEKLWQGHINRSKRNKARGTGFTVKLADLDKPSNTIVARYGKDGKECLIGQEEKPPRMLTLRETSRIQGFPETFKPAPTRTQGYRQFGNSVAVPVVTKLAEKIKSYLDRL